MDEKIFYELTNPQKSIWYTEEVFKGTPINNICTSGTIYNNISEVLLKKAINLVVEQNDSFRIHLVLKNETIKQYISEYRKFDIDIIYIDSPNELEQIQIQESKQIFNLIDSDLFKFKIAILKNKFACVILTANHIISDSWSMGITIQEIIKKYHELENSKPISLDTFSYTDYINYEIEYKNSIRYIKDKTYWENTFSTIPEQATIPATISQSVFSANTSNRINFNIEKKLVEQITSFCKKHSFSTYNFFMAIFSTYIGRVSNCDDFVIGTPILNRTNFKEKHTTGMFINTVPLRITNTNSYSFKDFTSSISQKMIGILKHQKYSYNTIIEDLRAKNNNIPNLYNILISYQITKAFNKNLGNYTTDWIFNNYCANDLNIHIFDINDTGEYTISYDYLKNKYEQTDIEDLHSRIIYMIHQVLNNADVLTTEIEIVTEAEKNAILYDFNNTDANYPREKSIVDLFEEQVKKTPDNIAVVYEGKSFTYKELNEKANSLARYLIQNGIKNKDIIGIRIDKSLEMVIGILAIIKTGSCYLPINMQYPKERVEFMLSNSNAKILLGTNHSLNEFKLDIPKIDISLSNTQIYSLNTENLNLKISPEDLIYIIYTSGTTGTPKGAMLCHRNVVRLMKNDKFLFDFNDKDVWPLFHSVAFDVSVWEMYGAFLYGGKLVVVPDNVAKDPNMFLDLINREQVTVLCQTPTYFYNLSNCEVNNPHTNLKVRYIIYAGEALKTNLLMPWHKLHPETRLINMYGITEITVHGTFKELSEEELNLPASDIGVPLPTLKMLVLDKNLRLLPYGVPGEICVSGDGVFKGYLNRPELNELKLVPNPYNPNEILYRSADLAALNKNNTLEFLGRIDTQVKIRGFRVELSEIEEKIFAFPNIKSCTVITKDADGMHDILCAYYISKSTINISELRKKLQHDLPEYMIPQYFIEVKEWPYNVNGKIDKKRLPEPQYKNVSEEIILPRNETDKKLIEILKDLLNIDNVSITDSFFNIGGDSLIAINLCMKVQSEFNVGIYVKDILQHPILQDLSDFIARKSNISEQETINTVEKADYYPISAAQKRIYLASQAAGIDSKVYNVSGALIIEGNIDTKKLETCLNTLINRHESLRTYFEIIDNKIVQKIADKIDFELQNSINKNFDDLNNIYKDFIKPFDLSKPPLFRAKFVSFTNGKNALLVDMHHIISDGTSLRILTTELSDIYNGTSLPAINITYKDFANYENNKLEDGSLDEAEKYWLEQFKDNPSILNMPTTYPRPAIQSFQGNTVCTFINEELVTKLQLISTKLNITPYMLLLSSYYILLAKYSSQEDIIVGTPIAGRTLKDVSDVVGMFVNTLALRNNVDGNLTVKDFILSVKNNLLNSYKYQSYPFDELVNNLDLKRDSSRNPLFDTMFIYQNNGYSNLNFDNVKCEYYIPNIGISKFDLSLEIIPNNKKMNLNFEYATSLFDEKFIKDLSQHYLNIINNVLDNTDLKIADIDMLSKDEKQKLLYEFNNTDMDFPKDKNLLQLFENQVNTFPNNIAVVFENDKLTYKELNEKANQLANHLKSNGIKENDVVAILLNRSFNLIIAIYAVIKSGASFVLIDNSFPEKRIKYILNDSKAKYCITNNESTLIKNCININDFNYSSYNNANLKINCAKNLCIIYTSGSTGTPKGVLLHGKGFINLVYAFDKEMDISKYRNILGISNVSFDMFTVELFSSTLFGNTLVLANEDEQKNPLEMSKLIKDKNVEFFITTPSRIELLLSEECNNPLKNIKAFQLGGEEFSVSLYNKLIKNTKAKIFNGYGPTEITACCTNKYVTSDRFTIGKPISNVKAYICDKNLNILPIGLTGEICIAGAGVSNGYINNEETTSKVFVKNPFGDGFIYKTGDLGKYMDNGEIIYLGRIDNQIKLRGLRIELEEIENTILNYPGIDKITVVKQCLDNHDFLSAYYISNKKINLSELRKYLFSILPQYMIPSYFTKLDAFPYTNSGKIDKKSLPLPKDSLHKENFVEPQTDLQKQLARIWEKLLNIEHISINDNFFELGGDSLLAMGLNVELLKISNNIKYSDIFRFPTIAELEQHIFLNNEKPNFRKIENLSDNFIDILDNNTSKIKINKWHPRNVLLTGSTGFLGIHILEQLIQNEQGNIYCIIRNDKKFASKEKLKKSLNYYFDKKYDDLIDKRIFAITGNTSEPDFGLTQIELLEFVNKIDVVINCAANVSHFGNYNELYHSNVESAEYIINFCKEFDKKLYHVSTTSISGSGTDLTLLSKKKRIKKPILNESSFYVGQIIDNVYARSKFEAENAVLTAIANGLDGYILRMGNLMPRYNDGVFQENILKNSFISKILSFIKIGVVPDYLLKIKLEFTPVDYAAKAIYNIITNPSDKNRIFHLFNHNKISVKKFIAVLKKYNFNIDILDENQFKNQVEKLLSDNKSKNLLKDLANDFDKNLHLNYDIDIIIKSNYTIKYLRKTGFKWPIIRNTYLTRFIDLLRKVI